jgi:hypothetical protein
MPSEYTLDSVETLSYAEEVGMSEEGRKKKKENRTARAVPAESAQPLSQLSDWIYRIVLEHISISSQWHDHSVCMKLIAYPYIN